MKPTDRQLCHLTNAEFVRLYCYGDYPLDKQDRVAVQAISRLKNIMDTATRNGGSGILDIISKRQCSTN